MAGISLKDRVAIVAIVISILVATTVLLRNLSSHPPARDDELRERVARLEEQRSPNEPSPSSTSRRALERRIEALEAAVAAFDAGRDIATPPAVDATATIAPAAPPPQAALHDALSIDLTTDAMSREHAAAVTRLAEHLVTSAGPPRNETELAWAKRALLRQAIRDRIGADEAAALEPVLLALPVGHAARTPLAQAVAIGWSSDTRMSGFLSHFATNSEPALHQGVLAILDDEHPSDAFSEYVIRIIREEREPAVLSIALGLDRIEAAATAAEAPRVVDAIARRVEGGDLETEMRARAGLAIAVASLRAPVLGVSTLRGLADREADAELQTMLRECAEQLATGDATLKSLERLFD